MEYNWWRIYEIDHALKKYVIMVASNNNQSDIIKSDIIWNYDEYISYLDNNKKDTIELLCICKY